MSERSDEESKILDRLRSLSISAAYEILTGFDRLRQLRQEMGLDGNAEESAERKRKSGDLVYRLAKMELEHAENILNLGHAQADLLFDHARALARTVRVPGESAPRVVELSGSLVAGANATGTVTFHNPFEQVAHPRFELDDLRTQDGKAAPWLTGAATVACVPNPLPPRSAAQATVSVSVAGAPPEAAGVYFGELRIYIVGSVERLATRRALKLLVEG